MEYLSCPYQKFWNTHQKKTQSLQFPKLCNFHGNNAIQSVTHLALDILCGFWGSCN